MESNGIACKSVGPSARPNLIMSTHDWELGPLVIHGHMDTIPVGPRESWTYDPFGGELVDGKIYGRGSSDMKGPLSAVAESMLLYADEKHDTPLVMLVTSDEESGCLGAEEVAKNGILQGVKYGVCAEPTELNVLVGERGMFWSKVVTKGKAAHGSRPEEGLNAIELCIKALQILKEKDYPYEEDTMMGRYTLGVGMIRGGIKINVVPDRCQAHLDMRLVKGQTIESVTAEMKSRLAEAGLSDYVEIEYIHGKPAVITPIDSEIVTISLEAVESVTGNRPTPTAATYGTDCSVLQPKIGITNVICGPGSITQAHQSNEYIRVDQLLQSVDVYLKIARKFD